MKIRTRLTLWFTILVTSLTLISGIFIWASIKKNLDEDLIKDARSKYEQVQNVIYFLGKEYKEKNIPLLIEDPDIFLYILSESHGSLYDGVYLQLAKNGRVVARSPNLVDQILPVFTQGTTGSFKLKLPDNRLINVFYYSTSLEFSGREIASLQIGIPMTKNEDFLYKLLFYESIEFILVLLCSIFLGHFLSLKALSPVSQITAEVENMEVKDFSKRLDTSSLSGDEIGKLAVTFNRLLERIANSIKIQNRFVSDASHELRSPLTAIIGHAELLEKRGKTNPEVLAKSSEVIIREGKRLMKLVNDLLYLARSGVKNIEKQQVNLNELIKEAVSGLQPLYPQIKMSLPEQNLFVTGEPDSLQRVLINLINNSLVAINENGEIIVSLTENITENTNNAQIQIKDNGTGISEEDLTHIFERFYRADKARERSKGGSGLGLAIVNDIIKNHQGTIDVKSEVGKGTTFIIDLPLSKNHSLI